MGLKTSFCGSKVVILRVWGCKYVILQVKNAISGSKKSFYGPLGYKIFGNKNIFLFMGLLKSSFCGCKDVILQIYSCHFVGLMISFSGS